MRGRSGVVGYVDAVHGVEELPEGRGERLERLAVGSDLSLYAGAEEPQGAVVEVDEVDEVGRR